MINTVRGLVSADELGKVYMHEHIYADLSGVRKDDDSVMTDADKVIEELKYVVSKGIKTFVDVSCIGMGRDVNKLKYISEKLDVNIIASTGYYLTSYYPEYIFKETAEQIAQRLIDEIENGIDGTGIKPGIIGEIATGKNQFTDDNKKVFEAAAIAHNKTGLPVTTHSSAGTLALEQAEFLIDKGVKNNKIIIGHLDLLDDTGKLVQVLDTGTNIGFDTIGKNAYISNEKRVDNLIYLLDKGYEDQIILSVDISRKSYYKSLGGYGYDYLIDVFLACLAERGVTENQIDKMLVQNPKRILDMERI